jgi:hypothetical protein
MGSMDKYIYVRFRSSYGDRYLAENKSLTGAFSKAKRFPTADSAHTAIQEFLSKFSDGHGDWLLSDITVLSVTEDVIPRAF